MLSVKNIHKVYKDAKRELSVLKGVNLKVEKGEFIAITGPSGVGKSTLLHILGGLDNPNEGNVLIDGADIYKLKDNELSILRNKKIGFIFQFYHLLPEFNALENVLMPFLITGHINKDSEQKARDLLSSVGLGERMSHFPSQLSGGEKQRVAIARSLINNPKLLLCDEPTGNLDSDSGEEIVALIKKVSIENKMSVILVTHNKELARTLDTAYCLRDGLLAN